jgi:hypothetical protein
MKIGERIDELHELREDIRNLTTTLNEMKENFNTKEFELLNLLQDIGLDQAKSDRTTVFVKTDTVGTVEDWDAFENYIKDNDALYLLQRRLSTTAYRELLQMGEDVPGVKQTELTKLSMRNT